MPPYRQNLNTSRIQQGQAEQDSIIINNLQLDLQEAYTEVESLKEELEKARATTNNDEEATPVEPNKSCSWVVEKVLFLGDNTPLALHPVPTQAGQPFLSLDKELQAYVIATLYDIDQPSITAWYGDLSRPEQLNLAMAWRIAQRQDLQSLSSGIASTKETLLQESIELRRKEHKLPLY